MKLKIVIYSFVLLLSMILLNNCIASMLGVPDTFKGYYQSVNTVLDDKTYLFFRVSAGGLTIYLGDDGTTNIIKNRIHFNKSLITLSSFFMIMLTFFDK